MTADVTVSTRVSPSRAKRRLILWGVHSSGRFDRPDAAWRASLRRLRKQGSWITGTEAAGRSGDEFRRALDDLDWDYAHLSGAAVGECYATWDSAVLELHAPPFARKLTDKTWVRSPEYGGKTAAKVHALVVPLRTRTRPRRQYVLIVVHWPLDNTDPREEAWVDVNRGLLNLIWEDLLYRWDNADFILVGDVNKNLRQPVESAAVHDHIEAGRFVACWRGRMPDAGTHGRDVIDMAFGEPRVISGAELLADDGSSDHRPFKFRLRGWIKLPAALRRSKH